MKIDRLMAITNILINKKKVTAKYLAEHFEVSIRTIYRDIETLEMSGIPIITYQGSDGGIGILDNFKLSKDFFKPDELWSILKALDSISFSDKKINLILEKLKDKIPVEQLKDLKQNNIIKVNYKNMYQSKSQIDKFEQIKQAILDENIIQFRYRNNNNEMSFREVNPLELTYQGYSWYLSGYCKLKSDYRIFKLNKIRDLNILKEKFIRKNLKLPDFMTDFKDSKVKKIDLKLKFDKSILNKLEEYFEEDSIDFINNENILVNVSFPMNDWVYEFILGFGDKVEVLEPLYFREKIINIINNLYNKYY